MLTRRSNSSCIQICQICSRFHTKHKLDCRTMPIDAYRTDVLFLYYYCKQIDCILLDGIQRLK
ncbi:hypothetical protein BpHYR1_049577 [Brachionus plicatilis]|uniref:Uncharacterized protein n=1 Tax=Brachionus plicatilis TaxID=10195 RepID=A0A3M7P430_BRAPC|nr:hypothetical protein BpHYR1_049577 [Brachionus plicatilis]